MNLWNFICIAMLAAVFVVGAGSRSEVRSEGQAAESSVRENDVRTRFLVRIQSMLDEAGQLDRSGNSVEAMRIADRAARMLDAIGGEVAWHGNGMSPAQFLERFSGRKQNRVQVLRPVSASGLRVRDFGKIPSGPDHEATPGQAAADVTAVEISAGRRSTTSAFPDLPERNHAWVPVGRAVHPADDWMPLNSDSGEAAAESATVLPAGLPVPDRVTGIRQPVLEPFPAEQPAVSPAYGDRGTGLPIRNTGNRQRVSRPDAENSDSSIPAGSVTSEIARETESIGHRSGTEQTAGSRLFLATVVGALVGVCLLLVAWSVRGRFRSCPDGHAGMPAESTPRSVGMSGHSATRTDSGPVATAVPDLRLTQNTTDNSTLTCPQWMPGLVWSEVGMRDLQKSALTDTGTAVFDRPSCNSPQGGVRDAVDAESDGSSLQADCSDPDPSPVPIVPLRVFGTSVVLGEEAVAKVDEVLEQRRQSVLRAVFDRNVALQNSVSAEDAAKAA